MRITNQLFFQNTQYNYSTTMNDLYKTNQKLATGLKIQNSYEDSGVYVDAMRLNYEAATLAQSVETSTKAQAFANNTDKAFNQFAESLEEFKVKLVQVANEGAMSSTSREAIANELETIRDHLMSIANTSINGNFLFSGSATSTKPIAADGTYQGNGEALKALVGSEVQLQYNIDGLSLFLGSDSDYYKILTTNVAMLNQSELYPEVMDNNSYDISEEVYLSETDTIRDMVGDIDGDPTNDPDTVFYISGINSYGEAFNKKIQMTSDAPVSDLLEQIGNAFGNTSTNKLVDVTLNNQGQIEIKDLNQGSNQIEFHMFGAVDRAETGGAGNAGNADATDLDTLFTSPNVDIIEFTKSNYDGLASMDSVASREIFSNPGTFKVGFALKLDGNDYATATTELDDIFPSEVDSIMVGSSTISKSGNSVNDLLLAIEAEYPNTTASIQNGQIYVTDDTFDPSTDSFGDSGLVITLTTLDATSTNVAGFATPDALNFDRRGFEVEGNELSSNLAQIINETGEYASAQTKLIETAGVSDLDGREIVLTGFDVSGNEFDVTINLDAAGSTFTIGADTYTIYDGSGVATPANEVTYQQLLDIVTIAVAGQTPQDPISVTNATAIQDVIDDAVLNGGTIDDSLLDLAYAGAISEETKGYILDAILADLDGDLDAKDEALRMADLTHYGDVIEVARMKVDVSMDERGRIEIVDKTSSVTDARLTMYDPEANNFDESTPSALSFMANDALIIDEPSINFFEDLDNIIEAVRNGTYYPDADGADPRNIGIHNSIERLDHIADHFTKEHTKIGALSTALNESKQRVELLKVNVMSVKSEIIDADYGETMIEFQQLSLAYQAMLNSISQINSMSLLNYM